jgi:hypothetical protein
VPCLCRSLIPPSQTTNRSTTLIGLPSLAALHELSLRQPWIHYETMFEPFHPLDQPCRAIAVTYSKFLPYPILIPSHIPPSKTVAWMCFGKTVMTFAYELGLGYLFLKFGRIKFHIQPNPTQSSLPMERGPTSTSKAPNSELGQCFKFQAKNCGISIGHTFCPIELKIGVLPI